MDTPHEPSGDEAEYMAIFREARKTARSLFVSCNEAQDYAMLVEAVETLAHVDPAFGSWYSQPSNDTVAVPESDPPPVASASGTVNDEPNEDDDDDDDGGSPVVTKPKVTV